MNDSVIWCIEDAPAYSRASTSPAWTRAFPVWWAAACGAEVLIHSSAGTLLQGEAGGLAYLTDHINLSGSTPLEGLGESRLGPLFPDQTRVHDERLAALAQELAEAAGDQLVGAVAACVHGPSVSTRAELWWQRSAGANLSVQDVAAPLVAAELAVPEVAPAAEMPSAASAPSPMPAVTASLTAPKTAMLAPDAAPVTMS